jgi:hypothetical protein
MIVKLCPTITMDRVLCCTADIPLSISWNRCLALYDQMLLLLSHPLITKSVTLMSHPWGTGILTLKANTNVSPLLPQLPDLFEVLPNPVQSFLTNLHSVFWSPMISTGTSTVIYPHPRWSTTLFQLSFSPLNNTHPLKQQLCSYIL